MFDNLIEMVGVLRSVFDFETRRSCGEFTTGTFARAASAFGGSTSTADFCIFLGNISTGMDSFAFSASDGSALEKLSTTDATSEEFDVLVTLFLR